MKSTTWGYTQVVTPLIKDSKTGELVPDNANAKSYFVSNEMDSMNSEALKEGVFGILPQSNV